MMQTGTPHGRMVRALAVPLQSHMMRIGILNVGILEKELL